MVATGKDRVPFIPPWPGRNQFSGQLLHVAEYRNPAPFVGQRTLVVGAGSSAIDIALDLAEGGAAEVAMAVRTPPHLVRRSVGGLPADLVGGYWRARQDRRRSAPGSGRRSAEPAIWALEASSA